MAGVASDSQSVVAIGAGVGEDNHLIGDDGPVVHHTGAHLKNHRVATGAACELLFAGVFHLHRAPGGDGQVSTGVLNHHLLLVAKAAADTRLDNPDAFDRQSQDGSQHAPDMERHLG